MIISETSLVNLVIEVIGVMVSVFSLFMLTCGLTKDKGTISYFSFGFSTLLIYHLSLLAVVFLGLYSSERLRYLVLTAGFMTYLTSILTVYTVSAYLVFCLSLEDGKDRILKLFFLHELVQQTLPLVWS